MKRFSWKGPTLTLILSGVAIPLALAGFSLLNPPPVIQSSAGQAPLVCSGTLAVNQEFCNQETPAPTLSVGGLLGIDSSHG